MHKTVIVTLILIVLGSFALVAQPLEEQQNMVMEETMVTTHGEDGLTYMREEEKLARDVYLALYEKWGIRTFLNIAKAEQQHMDAVGALLDARNLKDPAKGAPAGVFQNAELAKLYNELVALGSQSAADAFLVGAIIEDLDIYDLNQFLAQTEDEAEIWIYTNLKRGSESHMRSFVRQLERYGKTYEARYISSEELASILRR
jgi:hypothetical protein